MQRLIFGSLVLLVSITASTVRAGIAYPDPPGGWVYTYNGAQAACGGTLATDFDALDGTWNRANGSSEWDCSIIDGVTSTDKPGGAMAISTGTHPSEVGVTYLRIQDPGNPAQYSGFSTNGCGGCTIANPANRKVLFVHDMTAEGCPDGVFDTVGFTITFRARIPTPGKTSVPPDPLYPSGESSSGVQPYPADGDGIILADNGNGCVSATQLAGGKVGFSLVTSNDNTSGTHSGTFANFRGLQVNGLIGTTINNNIDFGEAPTQYLPLDPTEWNEFWIVVQRDDSGLGTHTLLVYTNGSLSPIVFHVTAASNPGEASGVSHIEMGSSQTGQNGAVDLDFLAYKFSAVFPPGAGGPPPTILSVSPTPPASGNTFWSVASGISFSANATTGKTIANAGVLLVLNGVDVSSGLTITGGGTASISATYSGLAANTIYTGTIQVTDSAGSKASFPLKFDTFTTNSTIVIEAEDYNYTDGVAGKFIDNPTPGAYGAFTGTEGIDFHDVTPLTLGVYRTGDAVDSAVSADTLRDYVNNAGQAETDVAGLEQGEWMNYTRTFAAGGKYKVYLRYLATAAQSVRLDLVTSDRSQPNQTTAFLGSFSAAATSIFYTYAQLTDAFGNPLVLNLSGVQTVRLTTPKASVNLALNYLVFVPTTSTGNGPVIGYAAPAPNSTDMLPDAPILVAIDNRDTSVVVGSISNFLDGIYVTPSSTIAATPSGASIFYQPASQLAINSTHTNRVIFNDGTTSYTNQWTFTVANLPVLLSSWATAPGSGTSPGFNGQIHEHNSGQALIFVNNATRAENQVANLLIDVDTGLPYVNQAAGPNSDGTFTETGVINYSDDGLDAGFIPGDAQFPYIVTSVEHLAMVATAHLDLTAGLHRFGVRRNAGFKLASGPHFSRAGASLTVGIFESTANDPGLGSTEFDFMVQSAGVYPFRLIYFQNNGKASLEWYSVDRTTGARTLINSNLVGAVKAYMSRPLLTLTPQKILNPRIAGTTIQFEYQTLFGYTYYVDYRDSVSPGSWTADPTAGFAGDGSVHTFSIPSNASTKRYYHIRAQ